MPGGVEMKVKDVMTPKVICISPEESVNVAARTLTHYNIGVLPVCTVDGQICGMLTDRGIVTRCLASGQRPEKTAVRSIMTNTVISAKPDMDAGAAASLMARRQVRRLPVVDGGKLCGMVTLGDLSQNQDTAPDATDALAEITGNVADW
jgi:CBS domain-containing protein